MAFKMKGSSYKKGGVKTKKTMAYMKSTAMKHNVDDNKEHQDTYGEDHSEDLQTEAEHRKSFETSNKSDNQKMSKKIVRTDLDKPMGEGKAPIKHSGIHGTKSHEHPHGNPRTKVPMKQTDFFDKVKSAGKAIYNNVGKVNSVGNSLSDKISSDYGKNKKEYRDNAKKK